MDNCGCDIFEFQKRVERVGKGYLKRCDIVKRFRPLGYQIEKSNMLRLVLFNPKTVPEFRKLLKQEIPEITDLKLYEADIPFATNRFLVDNDIDGMDVLEFSEKGKELENYGLNCKKLYICTQKDIKVIKDEMVKIEY